MYSRGVTWSNIALEVPLSRKRHYTKPEVWREFQQ